MLINYFTRFIRPFFNTSCTSSSVLTLNTSKPGIFNMPSLPIRIGRLFLPFDNKSLEIYNKIYILKNKITFYKFKFLKNNLKYYFFHNQIINFKLIAMYL